MMHIIPVPGLWLHGSSWNAVVTVLQRAGHRTYTPTLPGMESKDADRSAVALADHVAAVVAAVDDADPPVLLVGHSAGSGIAHAAVDARARAGGPRRVCGRVPCAAGRAAARRPAGGRR